MVAHQQGTTPARNPLTPRDRDPQIHQAEDGSGRDRHRGVDEIHPTHTRGWWRDGLPHLAETWSNLSTRVLARTRPVGRGHNMKKLINDPGRRRQGRPPRHRGRAPGPAGRPREPDHLPRRRPGAGKVGLVSGGGSGHEPLHGGFVGLGHARRRLRRRGVHLPGARPDAGGDQGGRRRRRRAAHREELHRRRDELRDGGRAGGGRAGVEVGRSSPTTTSPSRTASTRPVGAASASPCCSRRSPARPPRRAGPLSQVADVARQGQRAAAAAWAWRSPPARSPPPGKPTFDLPDDEMEVGIGIHGEPGRRRAPIDHRGRDRRDAGRADPRGPRLHGDGDAVHRVRQRDGRHAAASSCT